MSFHYVLPTVCSVAIGKLAPSGVKQEDAGEKILSVIRSEFGKIDFAESTGKSKSFKRLKLAAKKQEAAYQTRMAGSTKEVSTKAMDCYNWLADIFEVQGNWGEAAVTVGAVPKEIHDWVTSILANMSPSKEGVSAKDAGLVNA
jgi:hypothetical protein